MATAFLFSSFHDPILSIIAAVTSHWCIGHLCPWYWGKDFAELEVGRITYVVVFLYILYLFGGVNNDGGANSWLYTTA